MRSSTKLFSTMRSIGLIFLIALFAPVSSSLSGEPSREEIAAVRSHNLTLIRGIGALKVVVETIGPEFEAVGFKRTVFQTDVEIRLRMAGIRVTPLTNAPSMPDILFVTLVPIEACDGFAVAIRIKLAAAARLERDPALFVPLAVIWDRGSIVTVPRGNMDYLRRYLKDRLDEFINLYLEANPPKPTQKGE